MTRVPLLVAIAGVGSALLVGFRPAPPPLPGWTVWITGGLEGHLAPCGCTAPQSGGIVRRSGAIARTPPARTIVLDAGGWIAGTGPQDELKGDTVAATLGAGPPAAVLLTADLRRIGERLPTWRAAARATFIGPGDRVKVGPLIVAGAKATGTVAMVEGGLPEARALIVKRPSTRLVVLSRSRDPVRVGSAWVVGPIARGKGAWRTTFRNGSFSRPVEVDLGPAVPGERRADRLFRDYLARVDGAGLLDRLPREPGDPFAGDRACGTCHAEAARVHEASSHAHAYDTLVKDGHGRDPDCVSCHVVGLDRTTGFRSAKETPDLARVGCESCHGAGAAHAVSPVTARMRKIGFESCLPCHTPENSPNFRADRYWTKIRHGLGKTSG